MIRSHEQPYREPLHTQTLQCGGCNWPFYEDQRRRRDIARCLSIEFQLDRVCGTTPSFLCTLHLICLVSYLRNVADVRNSRKNAPLIHLTPPRCDDPIVAFSRQRVLVYSREGEAPRRSVTSEVPDRDVTVRTIDAVTLSGTVFSCTYRHPHKVLADPASWKRAA